MHYLNRNKSVPSASTPAAQSTVIMELLRLNTGIILEGKFPIRGDGTNEASATSSIRRLIYRDIHQADRAVPPTALRIILALASVANYTGALANVARCPAGGTIRKDSWQFAHPMA